MAEEGRRMYAVGVEGDLFRPHPENYGCARHGCVAEEQAAASEDAIDAARYRFLRDHARPTNPSMDGSFAWYVPSLTLRQRARTFDAAVDRAMGQKREPQP